MKINFKLLEKADIVSFDIFDTLLKRNVPKPEDIFDIIEKLSGVSEFAKKRKKAACKAQNNCIHGEATLDTIYNFMDIDSKHNREQLQALELQTEQKYIQANFELKPIYEWCLNNNKRIIAVSDMYLSSQFLYELLSKNGFLVEQVFVSCEEGVSKRSGDLFKVVSDKTRCKNILHIGDSWTSDYFQAIGNGWKAIHYKTDKTPETIVDCVIRNNQSDNYFKNLGYSVLGPLLFSFSVWLNYKTTSIDTLLFFSRDGFIMQKAFEAITKRSSVYVHVSRQSLITATLWLHPDFEDLKEYIINTPNFTLNTFIKRIGLEPNDIPFEKYHLIGTKEYECEKFWKDGQVRQFYESIKPKVVENSHYQYDYFFKYIEPFIKGEKIGIVDIGWKATMQTRFVELLKSNPDYENCLVQGFYLGVEKDTSDVEGFWYKSSAQTKFKTAIDAGYGLIETLFLAREGTTIKYSEHGPVQDIYEVDDEKEIMNLKNIHTGAIEFINKILSMDDCEIVYSSPEETFQYFEKLVYYPSSEDVNQLGNIAFNDLDNMTLINGKGLIEYIFSFNSFIGDYHKAPWKIGFLKKNIANWIPWGLIYKIMKNV